MGTTSAAGEDSPGEKKRTKAELPKFPGMLLKRPEGENFGGPKPPPSPPFGGPKPPPKAAMPKFAMPQVGNCFEKSIAPPDGCPPTRILCLLHSCALYCSRTITRHVIKLSCVLLFHQAHPFSAAGMSQAQASPVGTDGVRDSPARGSSSAGSAGRRNRPDFVLKELEQGVGDLERFVVGQKALPRKIQRQAMPPTPMYKA